MAEKNTAMEHVEYGSEKNGVAVPLSKEISEKDGGLRTVDAGVPADQIVHELDDVESRRILWKTDIRLIPLLAFLYLIAYIDRGNIGNAKIAGMTEDLDLAGTHASRYNIALTVFFVPYALLEVPSNILLKVLRPSIWLSIICFTWGLVTTLMGIVKNHQALHACRFFLGVAEAGFFPAATFLLTLWYRRYEIQRRMAVFYASASLSGAFSGLLAYGIEHMSGIAGYKGWRWIFILEGLVPIVVAFGLFFLLPDRPETARFLTKTEREFVVNRISLYTGSGYGRVTNSDKIKFKHIRDAFFEWKTWASVIPFWSCTVGTYGFTATAPTIMNNLGYTSANAQLMTVPVYVAGTIGALVVAWWSDRVQQRTPFIMGGFSIAAIGFLAELVLPQTRLYGVSYLFLFFIAVGMYSPFVCIVTLTANNLAPSSKRAVGMALMISIGNLGGICGSNIFLSKQTPHYPVGFGVSLGFCIAGIVGAYLSRLGYHRENKKRDAEFERVGEEGLRAMYTEEQLLDMGDRSPFYRYTL